MRNPFRENDDAINYPKSPSDRQHLVDNTSEDAISFGKNSPCSFIKRNKNCSVAILVIALVAVALVAGLYHYRIRFEFC
jgi:hypothetical protein